jgi:hypothetical protein
MAKAGQRFELKINQGERNIPFALVAAALREHR